MSLNFESFEFFVSDGRVNPASPFEAGEKISLKTTMTASMRF